MDDVSNPFSKHRFIFQQYKSLCPADLMTRALQDPDKAWTSPSPMAAHRFVILGFAFSQLYTVTAMMQSSYMSPLLCPCIINDMAATCISGFYSLFSQRISVSQVTNILMDKLAWKIAVYSLKGCFKTNKTSLASTCFRGDGCLIPENSKEQKMISHFIVKFWGEVRWLTMSKKPDESVNVDYSGQK